MIELATTVERAKKPEPKKKLLLATPAYGGNITSRYLLSMIDTVVGLIKKTDLIWEVYTLENESLIPRGRDRCALYALENGFDKLLFLDADMIWSFAQVERLLNSPQQNVGGTYPMKAFPITLNFNPLDHQCDLFGKHRQLDNFREFVAAYADERGEIEVTHVPTGFLLIDCIVFSMLSYKVPEYMSFCPTSGEMKGFFEFFPSGPTKDRRYESEDWGFCRLAAESGFKVWLNSHCVTGHTGTHHFSLGQHVVSGQTPLIHRVPSTPLTTL